MTLIDIVHVVFPVVIDGAIRIGGNRLVWTGVRQMVGQPGIGNRVRHGGRFDFEGRGGNPAAFLRLEHIRGECPSHIVRWTRIPRSAGTNVALASTRCVRTHPKSVERTVRQMKAEPNWLTCKGCEISVLFPIHLHQRLVRCDRLSILNGKPVDYLAVFVQYFDFQFAIRAIHVDEQILSLEGHGSRRHGACSSACIQRSKAVTTQDCQAGSRIRIPPLTFRRRMGTEIEVEFVADDQWACST